MFQMLAGYTNAALLQLSLQRRYFYNFFESFYSVLHHFFLHIACNDPHALKGPLSI